VKNIFPLTTVEDWVRNPDKQLHNASIIWKVVNSTFHLVGNWLIWKVGKGEKVQIGLDPWIGSKGLHRLPPWLIQDLRSKGFYTLRQIVNWERSTNWQQQWLTWEEMGLREEFVEEWKGYIEVLKDNNVKI
jgi:hypothetical protein